MAIEWKVAKEITLAVFHRKHEMARCDALQRAGQTAAMPDEIANQMGSHRPGAKNKSPAARLEDGEEPS